MPHETGSHFKHKEQELQSYIIWNVKVTPCTDEELHHGWEVLQDCDVCCWCILLWKEDPALRESLAHSTERTMLCPACPILSQLPVCTGGWWEFCSTGPSRAALCSWTAPQTGFTLLVVRALRGTHMIESICVYSCIHENPGYLLIAMQCCIMKAVHLFLRGKAEERSVTQGFFPEAAVVTDYPQRAPCSLLQESYGPALTNSWRLSPAQPVPGSFISTKLHLPSSELPLLFLNAGLHMTSFYNRWSGKPEVPGINPQSRDWEWKHLHGANLGLGIDISSCFHEQLHTVAVSPLSSQVQSCESFLHKSRKDTSSISVDKAETEQQNESDSTPSSKPMTCYSTSSEGQGSPVDCYRKRGHNYLPWTYQSTALSWMSLAVGHKTDTVFTNFPPLQPINKPKGISHGQWRQTMLLE